MLVIPEEKSDILNSENLSSSSEDLETKVQEDLKEFFTIIMNEDKFYNNMNFDDFIYGKINELEIE